MEIVTLSEAASSDIRRRLTGTPDGPLRVSYIPGPGDVVGTHAHWQAGRHDPRVPVITYSAMFYELMQRLGAEVQVLTPSAPSPRIDKGSIRFERVAPRPYRGKIRYQIDQMVRVAEAEALIAPFDPHVVLVSTDFPYRGWPKLGRGRRLILAAHNTFWPMGQPPGRGMELIKRRLLERAARALDGAICTSHECARQIADITGGRVTGGVQHPQMTMEHASHPRHQARRLFYLGRIERSKGIFMLLDAFLEICAGTEGLSLSFAGDGSASRELARRIEEAGNPAIRFLGRLDAAGVHGELAHTDLMICPTTSAFPEGLAMVCLEAAAHGAPTLASSVVPAIDLLGGACRVFAVDDARDLRRQLQTIVADASVFTAMAEATGGVQEGLQDRSRSWGSELGRVLLSL